MKLIAAIVLILVVFIKMMVKNFEENYNHKDPWQI